MLAIKEYLLSTSWAEDHLKNTRIAPSFFFLVFKNAGLHPSIDTSLNSKASLLPSKRK